jgi:hypothetical protein
LALNTAGRVKITADVFVHEKGNTLIVLIFIFLRKKRKRRLFTYFFFLNIYIEVIDIPRDSPLINQRKRISKEDMNSNEDQPPKISPPTSPIIKHNPRDDDEKDNAKRYMDKFKADRANKILESKSKQELELLKKYFFLCRLAKSL